MGLIPAIAMLSVHSCPKGNPGAKDTGGMSVYIRELSRALGRLGVRVDIYTRRHGIREPRIAALAPGVRLIHLNVGASSADKLAVYPNLPDFACAVELFRRRNSLAYGIVFSHYWLSGWVGEYLAAWWRVPHALMFHTLAAAKNSLALGETESELRLETEKKLARDTPLIIAGTDREKEDLVRYYGANPRNIAVVPCGVNLDLFRPFEQPATRRSLGMGPGKLVIFVGRIEALKGIERLIQALGLISENGSRPKLLVVGGDGRSRAEIKRLERLAGKLGIGGSVSFMGLVEHKRMPLLYSAADLCVIPSYYESYSLVALEALACGTPVVAADVGAVRDIVRDGANGYIVPECTPAHLARKITRALSGTAQSDPVRASVAGFGWPRVAAMIFQRFKSEMERNSDVAGS